MSSAQRKFDFPDLVDFLSPVERSCGCSDAPPLRMFVVNLVILLFYLLCMIYLPIMKLKSRCMVVQQTENNVGRENRIMSTCPVLFREYFNDT